MQKIQLLSIMKERSNTGILYCKNKGKEPENYGKGEKMKQKSTINKGTENYEKSEKMKQKNKKKGKLPENSKKGEKMKLKNTNGPF